MEQIHNMAAANKMVARCLDSFVNDAARRKGNYSPLPTHTYAITLG